MAYDLGTGYVQIIPSAKGIGSSISDILNGEAGEAGKSAGSVLAKGLGTGIKAVGAGVVAATAGMVAFGKSAVSAGQEFDSAMSQVAATMGFSAEELNREGSEAQQTFETLRNFAQDMGSSTAFSASEAASALNYMALAGYNAETSMQMLPTVLDLAAAGGIDLALASDMVTDAQTALGLSLSETSEMVDQMAMASSKSNTSVSQLGEAILTIGANARGINGGTSELTQVLGVLADNGIKGAEAGTHLRNIMLAMNPTTDAAAAAWEKLGVSAYDANGDMRSLPDVFQEISESMDRMGMTAEERSGMLSTMFNKTDLASVNSLIGTTAERWEELGGYIEDASGSAAKMAATQLDNLAGDTTLFKSALEGLQIAISDSLTPTLREFVQFGSSGLSEITEAFRTGGISAAVESLGTVLAEGLQMLIDVLPQIMQAGMNLLSALLEGIVINLPMIMDAVMQIADSFAGFIIENAPMFLSAAIGILAGIVSGIGESLPTLIPAAVSMILELVEGLIDNVDQLVNAAISLTIGLQEGLIQAIPTLLQAVPQIITKLISALIESIPQIAMAGVTLMVGMVQNLPQIITEILSAVGQIRTSIVSGIINGFPQLVNAGKELMEGLISGILSGTSRVYQEVKAFADNLIKKIKGWFGIHSPSTVFAGFGEMMMEGLGEGIGDNAGVVSGAMDEINGMIDRDMQAAVGVETAYSSRAVVEAGSIAGLVEGIRDTPDTQEITLMREQNALLRELIEKSGVYLDGKKLAASTARYARAMGV